MSDQYTRLALQKKLQGKELPISIKKGVGNLIGKKVNNQEAKKVLVDTLAYKSKYSREKIFRKAGFDYKSRDKVEQDLFGDKILSPYELRMQEKKRKMIIKRNIAGSRAVGLLGQKSKTGMNYATNGAKNRMNMMGDSDTHGASIRNFSSINTVARKNIDSLSVDANANKVAGVFGTKNQIARIGRGGVAKSVGLGRLWR